MTFIRYLVIYIQNKKFKDLIESLLEDLLKTVEINETQFMKIASIGLNSEKYKKYFEQIIACDNFVYFNCMMIKRNMILSNDTMKIMEKHSDKKQQEELKDDIKHNEKIKEASNNKMDVIVQEKKGEIEKASSLQSKPSNISTNSNSSGDSPQKKSGEIVQQPNKTKKQLEDEAKARELELKEKKRKLEEETKLKDEELKKQEEISKAKEVERKKMELEIEQKIKKDMEEQINMKQEMELKIKEEKDLKVKAELENKFTDLKSQKDNQLQAYREMMIKLKEEKRSLKK